ILGIAVVIQVLGIDIEVALVISFLVLAAFTYVSGLRAPALIALVKDTMIWITVIVAVIAIPAKLGGFGAVFAKVPAAKLSLSPSGHRRRPRAWRSRAPTCSGGRSGTSTSMGTRRGTRRRRCRRSCRCW